MPGAVVVDDDARPAVALVHREPHGRASVAPGVVEQVREGSPQLHPAAPHHDRHGGVDLEDDLGAVGGPPPGLLARLVRQVDEHRVGDRGALVEAGEEEQVGDHGLEAGLLGEQALRHPRPVVGPGRALGHLQLGADGGHR